MTSFSPPAGDHRFLSLRSNRRFVSWFHRGFRFYLDYDPFPLCKNEMSGSRTDCEKDLQVRQAKISQKSKKLSATPAKGLSNHELLDLNTSSSTARRVPPPNTAPSRKPWPRSAQAVSEMASWHAAPSDQSRHSD